MENASKALIIAGGMMIAIAVVGLFIFGFQKLRSYQSTQDESVKIQQVAEFNNQLEAYNKNVVPGYQMISLANYVADLNGRSSSEGFDEIKIEVDMKFENTNSKFGLFGQSEFDNFVYFVKNQYQHLSDSGDEGSKKAFKEMYFMCTNVETNSENGRINKMKYKKINKK